MKDWTEDFKYENGMYQNICKVCNSQFMGHKRRFVCKECSGQQQVKVEPEVKPEIADITKITMWVDMIWNDIFDDDELPLTASQMNIIGKYINDAKEKIRKQFSV